VKYLSAELVLFIHNRVIDLTGGAHGIRDVGLLKSAVARPRATFEGSDLYNEISQKAAALMESLVKNHAFIDGNKRTAITSTGIFLQMNGYQLSTSQKNLERFALDMATGKVTLKQAEKWLKKYSVKQD